MCDCSLGGGYKGLEEKTKNFFSNKVVDGSNLKKEIEN
jgi:hypothetical protein